MCVCAALALAVGVVCVVAEVVVALVENCVVEEGPGRLAVPPWLSVGRVGGSPGRVSLAYMVPPGGGVE